jgi:preprotein translocase subunit SecE
MSKLTEIYNSLTEYLKGAYEELQKVVWPTKQETIKYSLAVVAISLFLALFFGVFDFIFSRILEFLIS